MNRLHQWLCRSDRWRSTVQQQVPWVLGGTKLGPNVLELGPGPGLTTDLLRTSVSRLTALEIDPKLANALASRLQGSNVDVIEGNATNMPFMDSEFSGAVSFTMLHHVPSLELQDKVLREVFRVLKPGGFFVGSDSRQSLLMRLIHVGDTLVAIDPNSFGVRLESAGFEVHAIEKGAEAFRFCAKRPSSDRGSLVRKDRLIKEELMKQNADVKPRSFSWVLCLFAVVFIVLAPRITAWAGANLSECSTNPANRELDFWLGSWTVTYPGATSGATSTVSLNLDNCLVVENWDGGRGHSGENMFAYSPEEKTWYGMFADNTGRVHIFSDGKVASGIAEFRGPSHGPKGETVLNKVRVVNIDANRVEQTWQKSTDNGATWTTEFRGEYTRAAR